MDVWRILMIVKKECWLKLETLLVILNIVSKGGIHEVNVVT